MEMKHSCYNLYLKKTSLKLSKQFPQTKHASQMASLQILKTLHIATVRNLKTFSYKYLRENKFPGLIKKAEITRF